MPNLPTNWISSLCGAGLALALSCSASAQGEVRPGSAEARLLAAIPANVLFVRTTGPWRSEARFGLARMVLARIDGPGSHPRLYVQWLAADHANGVPQVIESAEVVEVADWRLRINDYRIEPTATGATVILDASPLPETIERQYVIEIGAPGEVKVSSMRPTRPRTTNDPATRVPRRD